MDLDCIYLEVNSYNTRSQANNVSGCIRDINEALYNLRSTTEANGYWNLLNVINSFDQAGMIKQLTIIQDYLNHVADITEKYEKMLSNQKVFSKSLSIEKSNFSDSTTSKEGEIIASSGVSRYSSYLEKMGQNDNAGMVDAGGGATIDAVVDGYNLVARYVDIYNNHDLYNFYRDNFDSGTIYIEEHYNKFYEAADDTITDALVIGTSVFGAGPVADVIAKEYKEVIHARNSMNYELIKVMKNEGLPNDVATKITALRYGSEWIANKLLTPKCYIKALNKIGIDFNGQSQNLKDITSFIAEETGLKDIIDNSDEDCIKATGKTWSESVADSVYTHLSEEVAGAKILIDGSINYSVEWISNLFNGGAK